MADDDVGATFKPETIQKIILKQVKDEKTRINSDALKLVVEYLRIFSLEAANRAELQAKASSSDVVDVEHLEKILPQLLLDF
ncbi:centromere protein X-like [Ptychodera flava]|uniref:centromere protein X-like n=1 Tax=Ptychodera flava TaxID=63121 RepID=UPI003969DBBC